METQTPVGNSPSVVLGALCRPEKDRYEQGGKGAPASGKPAPGMGSIQTARESGAPRLSSLSHELSPARSPALTTPAGPFFPDTVFRSTAPLTGQRGPVRC